MTIATPAFLLRVEGVNLYSLFSDTQQISVIRGASMALREAVACVRERLEKRHRGQVEVLSTGASAGLFRVQGDAAAASACRDFIADLLNQHELYRHLSFAVEVQPLADFERDREATLAKLRFRQLRQASVPVPPRNPDPAATPCPLDGLRPATSEANINDEKRLYSESVALRHKHGREQKRGFYQRETGDRLPGGLEPTWDLGQIADNPAYRQLDGKLAYLYADGNQFGKVVGKATGRALEKARKTLGGKLGQEESDAIRIQTLKAWDGYIQNKRREFLAAFVEEAAGLPGFLTPDGKLRLEVLLWGGDEFLLVVPAWMGFYTLARFFEAAARWRFPESGGEPLSHAAGLVFCQHKTPVHRADALARQLAERVKAQTARQHDAFEYAVLESIDFPTEPLDVFFQRLYPSLAGSRTPLRPWREPAQAALQLPKSQVYALARAALQEGDAFDKQWERFQQVVEKQPLKLAREDLARLFGDEQPSQWPWVRLAELWDYLAPEPE